MNASMPEETSFLTRHMTRPEHAPEEAPDTLTTIATRSEQTRAHLHTLTSRRYARLPRGTAIVGRDRLNQWHVVWCPNHSREPVRSFRRDELGFPADGAESIVAWLWRQPWSAGMRAAPPT